MSSKKVFDEIWSYKEFQKEIEKYFNEGINFDPQKNEQELYFIDYDWIKDWKQYSNYETIIGLPKDYENVKICGYLNYNENHNLGWFNTGQSSSNFLSKTLHKIEDFECLVDKKTFKLFKRYIDKKYKLFFLKLKFKKISGFFYEKMLVLITENKNKITLYSKFIKQPNDELIQLTLNLPKYKKVVYDPIKEIISFFAKKDE